VVVKDRPLTRFENISVSVVSLGGNIAWVKTLFNDILADFVMRKGIYICDQKWKVDIVFGIMGTGEAGVTLTATEANHILIQVAAPWMEDSFEENCDDDTPLMRQFLNTVCHEFVHACQQLTYTDGFPIKGMSFDPQDKQEAYYFDPSEVEARALSDFYLARYLK